MCVGMWGKGPIKVLGRATDRKMGVKGDNMFAGTGKYAGMSICSLVRKMFELPAHAVRGIDSIVNEKSGRK